MATLRTARQPEFTASDEDPAETISMLERRRNELLADLYREREDCRALGVAMAAEPTEVRNRKVSSCMDGVRASTEALSPTLRDLDAKIEALRSSIKQQPS